MHNQGYNETYNSKEYFIVYTELINAARHQGFVTYQQLAVALGLPVRGNQMGARLGKLLGAVSVNEANMGRPLLSAIAVTVKGEPGGGFYQVARDVGQFDDGQDKEAFWRGQVEAVYDEWRQEFSG